MKQTCSTSGSPLEAGREELAKTLPPAIQPHGCMVVFDDAFDRVIQISANCDDFLGYSVEAALQRTAGQLLGASFVKRLQQMLNDEDRLPGAQLISRTVHDDRRDYHVDAFRATGRIVVEIEHATRHNGPRLLSVLNQCVKEITSANDQNILYQSLVEGFQALTGYQQVYLVQFMTDDSGLVLAECDKNPHRSVLGCSFTAQAFSPVLRGRLRRNPLRTIPDLMAAPVPLLPQLPDVTSGLDLVPSMLQATSADPCRFMRDLGAQDFLGAALISDGSFWGLIVGHYTDKGKKSPARRDAARALVQAATQRLFLLQARERMRYLQRVEDSRVMLASDLDEERASGSLLAQYGEQWMSVFGADGIALILDSSINLRGETLPSENILTLIKEMPERMASKSVWQTHDLTNVKGQSAVARQLGLGGILVASLPSHQIRNSWIMLFRRERIETRFWLDPGLVMACPLPDNRQGETSELPIVKERITGQSLPWREEECVAIRDIAEDLSVAVAAQSIRDLNERLEALANTDPLTGVNNRRCMEGIMFQELESANRHNTAISALLLDIDHFKVVNDTYGHELGDRALIKVSSCIRQHLRVSDHLGRWGGEEFLILATHTDLNQAEVLADRLCKAVSALEIDGIGGVTISIGVAEWQSGDTIGNLISVADKAMYQAKEQGRNQFVRAMRSQ